MLVCLCYYQSAISGQVGTERLDREGLSDLFFSFKPMHSPEKPLCRLPAALCLPRSARSLCAAPVDRKDEDKQLLD